MGVIDRAGTTEDPRPKYLTRSGEFKAVHAGQVVAANDTAPRLNMAPERHDAPQGRRQATQLALKSLARSSLLADDLAHADVAAACGRSRSHVTDMLRPDGRNMAGDDVVNLAILSPAFAAGLAAMARIGKDSR